MLLFCGLPAMGQGSISGTIKDKSSAKVINAGVVLMAPGKEEVIRYAYSDSEGHFRFARLPYGKYTLEVSCLGYEKQLIGVECAEDHEMTVVLERKAFELNEVIIRQEKPVSVSKDTVTILTGYFTNGTEQNVEDLLRKIPGLTIDDEGTIKVGNQEVEKVMVEGDDFFEKGYKLLTKNMAAYPVEKVEIYRNYSHNKHLKGIENSSKVALNLSLREEVKRMWFGNGLAGYDGNRYQARGNLMNFGKKSKYYFLTHTNNIGVEVAGDLDQLIRPAGTDEWGITDDPPSFPLIPSPVMELPGLKKQRVTFNKARLLSLNSIFTFSDKLKLKTLGFIQADRNNFYRNSLQSVAAGTMFFENSEEFKGRRTQHTGFGNAELTYDISQSSTLRYSTRLSNTREMSAGELRFNSEPLNEKLHGASRLQDHNLHFTRKIAQSRVILMSARYLQEKTPQNYSVDKYIYEDLFPDGGGRTHQAVAGSVQLARAEFCLMDRKKNGNLLEIRMGGQWRKEVLQSRFQTGSDEAYEPVEFRNDMTRFSHDLYLAAKYLISFHRLQLITQGDLHYVFNRIRDETSGFFVVPKIGLDYKIGNQHKIMTSYTYNTTLPGIQDLYPQYIQTGFRMFSKGMEEFTLLNVSTALVNYTVGNWGDRFFVNSFLVYARNHHFLSTHTTLTPSYSLSEKIPADDRETVSLVSSADRYFKSLKSNLKISFSGSKADFKNRVNGSALREVNTTHLVYGWENRSAFRSFFNYHVGSKWIQNRIRTETVNSFTDRTSFLDLEFKVNRQLNIRAQAERYYFGRSSNVCYFMDLEARYDLIRHKLTLYLSGNNLLNTRTFRNYSVSDIGVSRTEYRLQPRLLLLKAEYRF